MNVNVETDQDANKPTPSNQQSPSNLASNDPQNLATALLQSVQNQNSTNLSNSIQSLLQNNQLLAKTAISRVSKDVNFVLKFQIRVAMPTTRS